MDKLNKTIRSWYDLSIDQTRKHHEKHPKLKQKELDTFCATKFTSYLKFMCLREIVTERDNYEQTGVEDYDVGRADGLLIAFDLIEKLFSED